MSSPEPRPDALILPWLVCLLLLVFHSPCIAKDRPILNDVHSQLNPTAVGEIVTPTHTGEVVAAVRRAKNSGKAISISGSRHSMGGQQFAENALHLDMTRMNRFISLDEKTGLARVEAGITWPQLLKALDSAQPGQSQPWAIVQKQTGADEFTIGGAVSSNIHGRGLDWQPIVQDIESLVIVDAEGEIRHLSRTQNREWFTLVTGGYGLFGVITEVELRLQRRRNVERIVEIGTVEGLPQRIRQRIAEGYLLGDFQFSPDETSGDFLHQGVFACYRPTTKHISPRSGLTSDRWRQLLIDAHADRTKAWRDYKAYYLGTHGQTYGSDLAQFNYYDPHYASSIQRSLPDLAPGSLMISEVYVPAEKLEDFMKICAEDFRKHRTKVIYGTIRFIRRDDTSFLPWAKQDYACIVFNLRVDHNPEGIDKARKEFRRLIDRALERDGSFFLTYHRWATPQQLLRAYPRFPEFLRLKKIYDPEELFQSEWYRHWRELFSQS
ncbi:MAG: FAD-binding oxidoreductase [Luteolibacter sp.]